MTATDTVTTRPATASAARRMLNVARLHVANPVPTLVLPVFITLVIFGLNAAIWALVVNIAGGADNLDSNAFSYNGGITWIIVFMMVVAVQAMNLTFSYAIGLSVTRRDYYLGTCLYFLALAVGHSAWLTGMAAIERSTDGWGVGGYFFAPFGMWQESLAIIALGYVTTMLLSFSIGAAVATMWVRWRAYGLYAFFLGLAVVLVGAGWAITAADAWPSVGDFLVSTPLEQLFLWTLPLTALCGVVGFLLLRRATPRG
ncbi:hypothetical protein [Demequina sp. NBRC 110056]|uniref:hypothetical protein n=1 Tax=Demequina sp. NBRC 110056 TaxID=1570345 RepID=UPI000A03F8CB|nr:hypothetical protein [Demequina sp. NBRC 110056]